MEIKDPKSFKTHLTIGGAIYLPVWLRGKVYVPMLPMFGQPIELRMSDRAEKFQSYLYVSKKLASILIPANGTSIPLRCKLVGPGVYSCTWNSPDATTGSVVPLVAAQLKDTD